MPSSTYDERRSLILYTIWMTALTGAVLWAAYLVRDSLLLIYISGLLAVGFSPIVRLIERQKVLPIGTRRFPRWLAILVLYLVILGARGHGKTRHRRTLAGLLDEWSPEAAGCDIHDDPYAPVRVRCRPEAAE